MPSGSEMFRGINDQPNTDGDEIDGEILLGWIRLLVLQGDFDPNEFVIAGSARLHVEGLKKRLSDIDVVARGATLLRAFELASQPEHGGLTVGKHTGDKIAQLFGNRINVTEHWIRDRDRTDELIAQADVIEGLRFISLEDVAAYKHELNRPKDRHALILLDWVIGTGFRRG